MKQKSKRLFLGRLGRIFLYLSTFYLASQAEAGYDIAVLNIDKLMYESKAAKQVQALLEKNRLKFQEEMEQQEKYFNDLDRKLVEQQKDLKPEEFAQKRKEFDAQLAEVHLKATHKREQLQQAINEAMSKLQEVIMQFVKESALKNGYKLVIPRNLVIYQSEADYLDITEEILKKADSLEINEEILKKVEGLFRDD